MSAASETALRMNYRIGRREQSVLTIEPYKSLLLPLYCSNFHTPDLARSSAERLWKAVETYDEQGDFRRNRHNSEVRSDGRFIKTEILSLRMKSTFDARV